MDSNNIIWPGWETVRKIGNGSFGNVYEIKRTISSYTEYAALKVITIPRNNDEIRDLRANGYDDESITHYYLDTLGRIESEYAMMANLKGHKNIVYCDDIRKIQHEDGFGWDIYIKMELLTPLKFHLTNEISEEEVIKLGIDICNALELCEEMNVIHRDIKPENIMVARDNTYKLGDFGIARTMEHTTNGTIAGTYDYMAPEIKNSRFYHTEVDIYSLGMVMYWMLNEKTGPFLPLNGKKPTPSMKMEAWNRRFDGEQIPPPKNGSNALKDIVLRACAYIPANRYHTPADMRKELEQLLNIEETVLLGSNVQILSDENTVTLRQEDYRNSMADKGNSNGNGRKNGLLLLIASLVLVIGGVLIGMATSGKFNGSTSSDSTTVMDAEITTEKKSETTTVVKEETMTVGNSETTTEKKAETTTEKKPETTTEKKPETTTAKKPETTTEKKPETTTEKKPETTTAKKPETTTEKKPETTTAKKPETTTEKKPETTTAKEPETTTEATNKKPTSYKISLSKSTVSLYERFTVVVTPNVTDYTKIVIHAIDPTGSRWDFSMSGTNSKTLYVDDASLTGTWKIYATVTNPYGSYTGVAVSLKVN